MERFRIYLSDQPSGVTDLEEVWCATEDEAITIMLDLAGRNAAEVWRGSERVFTTSRASSFGAVLDDPAIGLFSVPASFAAVRHLDRRAPEQR